MFLKQSLTTIKNNLSIIYDLLHYYIQHFTIYVAKASRNYTKACFLESKYLQVNL